MIKFHYHRAPRDIPRIAVEKGDWMCHVYSDTSLEELVEWGMARALKPDWVHHSSMPHYDAFGERLAECGEGVTRKELVHDIRGWRARQLASVASAGVPASSPP